jgi:transcriptional regulator with XRE-family HTH domain
MNPQWFGPRLRELREARGWTQLELAGRAVPPMTREGVAQLETGRREPAWRTVLALCQALGVTPDGFTQEPSADAPPKPGRPKKAEAADQEKPAAPRPAAKKRKGKNS